MNKDLLLPYVFVLLAMIAACRRNELTAKSSVEISTTASASPTLQSPPSTFVVTEDQVRKAFDDAELKGENKQAITVGEDKSVLVTAKDQFGKLENLKLLNLFLTPLDQTRATGYTFGLVAKQRTPEDRKAFEGLTISRVLKRSGEITSRVFLQEPSSEDVAIPTINYQLLLRLIWVPLISLCLMQHRPAYAAPR